VITDGLLRNIARANGWFIDPHPGQFPDPGAGWIQIAANIGIDKIRPAAGNASQNGIAQITGAVNADSFDTS
jgi:hypothetical protein